MPWHTQILADQLTLFQPGGTDYAHLITTGTPGFSDLPTALYSEYVLWFCPSVNSPPGQENIRRGLLCMYQSDMYVKIWSVNQNQNWNFEEKIQFGLPFAT